MQFLSNLGAILKPKNRELPGLSANLEGLSALWSDSGGKTRKKDDLKGRLAFFSLWFLDLFLLSPPPHPHVLSDT